MPSALFSEDFFALWLVAYHVYWVIMLFLNSIYRYVLLSTYQPSVMKSRQKHHTRDMTRYLYVMDHMITPSCWLSMDSWYRTIHIMWSCLNWVIIKKSVYLSVLFYVIHWLTPNHWYPPHCHSLKSPLTELTKLTDMSNNWQQYMPWPLYALIHTKVLEWTPHLWWLCD